MRLLGTFSITLALIASLMLILGLIEWAFSPRTDYIKQNELKLKGYGVPDDMLSLCNPLVTRPIDERCYEYIRPLGF